MKKEAAEFVARATLKASSEITVLIPFIKHYSESEEEYELFRRAITAIARIASEEIFSPIFSKYPEIDQTIDSTIKEFGRLP